MGYQNKLLENRWNTSGKIVEEFAPKSLKNFLQNRRTSFRIAEELAPKLPKNFLQNRWKTCSITAEKLAQKSPENLLKNRPKTCSKLQKNYSKMVESLVENLLQKRGRRNRKYSHSIYRLAKNYARFQPLYGVTNGRSTAILMDTAPFRGRSTAVLW